MPTPNSAASDLQDAIEELLLADGALRVPVKTIDYLLAHPEEVGTALPLVKMQKGDFRTRLNNALAKGGGLCVQIMTPVPVKVLQDVPFVFVTDYEISILVLETHSINRQLQTDCFEIGDDLMTALQWAPKVPDTLLGGMVAYPLQLKPNAVSFDHAAAMKEGVRSYFVTFTAVLQINPPE